MKIIDITFISNIDIYRVNDLIAYKPYALQKI